MATSTRTVQTAAHTTLRPAMLKPGEIARRSGRYEVVGPRGGRTGIARRVEKGAPLPPAPKPGQRYTLINRIRI